ncbi:MAG: PAS domain S-box protein [Candidatus Sulfotelmatobacter sp.]
METESRRLSPGAAEWDSPLRVAVMVCVVAILSYLASRVGGALILHPSMLSALWPGCALLVSVLLLVPRRMWPILIAAAFGAFVLSSLQDGVSARSIVWLLLADAVEVLTAAFCLSYLFDGAPRLNSVDALAKYSFFAVFLAPFAGAFVGALTSKANYWASWRTSFLSEALGFLTLVPAFLGWVREAKAWRKKPPIYYLEAGSLIASVALLAFLIFVVPEKNVSPALLYSLVPFLLWSALRFGSTGISTAVFIIAFLSIWGVTHGQGPFIGAGELNAVLPLQLFLFFTAVPFMILAVLVEQHKQSAEELRESEEKFRNVFRDAGIGMAIVSPEGRFLAGNEAFSKLIGYTEEELLGKTVQSITHPEDWAMFSQRLEQALATGGSFQGTQKRCLHKSGQIRWGECSASLIRDHGKPQYFVAEVLDVTDRKRAEQTLRESEARFRLVANSAPALIWMAGTDKQCEFFNKGWLSFTGRSMEQELGDGWAAGVHQEDLERCLRIYSTAFDARVEFEMEYRLRRFDGEYRWIVDYGVPRLESDGTFCGYIGSCVDITDRKLSQAALEELSGRLITAQEEERTRIARELHDDFTQRLALQGIGLTQVWKRMAESETEGRAKIQDLIRENHEILSDMHVLSHQLHSSRLEHVGLVPALMGLCEEISVKYKIPVDFTESGDFSEIPKNVSLCLFRVTQEALGNVVKHSGSQRADVGITCVANEIRLRIADAGRGFDSDLRSAHAGIGLIGMRERLRLVGGALSVRSSPAQGTEILAQVPPSVPANESKVKVKAAEV